MHCYFLLPALVQDTIYHVSRLRDGQSYASRVVRAVQNGAAIFFCSVSFQKPEEVCYFFPSVSLVVSQPTLVPYHDFGCRQSVLAHQFDKMPADLPPPDVLPSFRQRLQVRLPTQEVDSLLESNTPPSC
eukprot:m.281972 g.281972  ORF g.281972 m.281972 type:complete len:129 (-) comp54935_c1_seq37:738-1124(-)